MGDLDEDLAFSGDFWNVLGVGGILNADVPFSWEFWICFMLVSSCFMLSSDVGEVAEDFMFD